MKLLVEWKPGDVRTLEIGPDAAGVSLAGLLREHDLPLNTRCGGEGTCAGCRIEVVEGTVRPVHSGDASAATESPAPGAPNMVRACRVTIDPAGVRLRIRVPARSRADRPAHAVAAFHLSEAWRERLVCRQREARHGGPRHYGAAVDVGTTTVAVAVVDLDDGRIVGRAAAYNEQIHHGEDVITRIAACTRDSGMIRILQEAVTRRTIRPLLDQACAEAGLPVQAIEQLAVAGNTTMLHLLAGVDPSPLGTVPFRPAFLDARVVPGPSLGLSLEAPVQFLPGFAAYVGADLAAGCIASGLNEAEGPVLLVDAGTNGELLLKDGDRWLAASTALGPAFEGAGLSHGVRAAPGAIAHLRLRADPLRVDVDTIDGLAPDGLCGTAYLDFLHEARRVGLLTPTGRFAPDAAARAGVRWMEGPGGRAIVVAQDPEGRPVSISERDVARLLQAKAALAAGVEMLLRRAGRDAASIRRLYLAGGFGLNLVPEHAIGCGLLPGFRPDQIELAGNASLAGATLALLDPALVTEMAGIAGKVEVLALNLEPDFESCFIQHLALP